jgi:hypothetical protein
VPALGVGVAEIASWRSASATAAIRERDGAMNGPLLEGLVMISTRPGSRDRRG